MLAWFAMPCRYLLALALAACNYASHDDVSFDSTTGTAGHITECHCLYHSGVYASADIELSCLSEGEILGITPFLTPGVQGMQSASNQVMTTDDIYACGALGVYGTLGAARRESEAIVRSIDGLDFSWPDQDCCSIANGCGPEFPPYHMLAGAMHSGAGQCEDYDAEVNDDL